MNNQISSISKIYANSLIGSVNNPEDLTVIKTQLFEVLNTINSSNNLKIVFENSSINYEKKLEILDEIFGLKIDFRVLNLLKILVNKGRFSELKSIYSAFCEEYDNLSGIKNVEIVSPVDLNEEQKNNVLLTLRNKLKSEIRPLWSIDKSLIAGLVFKFDDYIIDTSVRTKIENLGKSMLR